MANGAWKGSFVKGCPVFDPKELKGKKYALLRIRKVTLEPNGDLKVRVASWGPPAGEMSFGLCRIKAGYAGSPREYVVKETVFAQLDNAGATNFVDQELDLVFPAHIKDLRAEFSKVKNFTLSLGTDIQTGDAHDRQLIYVDA